MFGFIKDKEVKELYLTDEPAICVKRLTAIRRKIRGCLKLHTEIYVMAQGISELVVNVQFLNFNIPVLEMSDDQIKFVNSLKDLLVIQLLDILIACYRDILKVLVLGTVVYCFITPMFKMLIEYTWDLGTVRRKILGKYFHFRKELEDSRIMRRVHSLFTYLSDVKTATKERLTESNELVDPLSLNAVMKCYKDYRRRLKDALEDPSNETTKEQICNLLVSQCSIPLRDRFKLSREEAKRLILTIDKNVTHEILNNN